MAARHRRRPTASALAWLATTIAMWLVASCDDLAVLRYFLRSIFPSVDLGRGHRQTPRLCKSSSVRVSVSSLIYSLLSSLQVLPQQTREYVDAKKTLLFSSLQTDNNDYAKQQATTDNRQRITTTRSRRRWWSGLSAETHLRRFF